MKDLTDVDEKIKNGMRYSIYAGVSSAFFFVMIQGVFLTGLALYLGADELKIGIIGSIPLLAQTAQLLHPILTGRLKSRKIVGVIVMAISRFIWLAVIFILLSERKNLELFMFIFTMSHVFGNIWGNIWLSWMRDLVPNEVRGKFFGMRNLFVSLTWLIATFIFSWILDHVDPPLSYQLMIAISMIGVGFAVVFTLKQYEPPVKESYALREFIMVFKDTNFRKLMIFGLFWNFIIMLTANFFSVHLLKNLKVPYTTIAFFSIVSGLLSILFYRYWGRISDTVGHKEVAKVGIRIVAFLALLWGFMNSRNYIPFLWMDAVLVAMGWTAINLSLITIPLEVAGENVSTYIAVYSSLNGISGFLGSIVGGIVSKFLAGVHFEIFGFEFFGLQFLFMVEGVLRFLSLRMLDRIQVRTYIPMRVYLVNTLIHMRRRFNIAFGEMPPIFRFLRRYGKIRKKEDQVL